MIENNTVKRMIFHAPFVLGEHNAKSASGIRPQKMLEAFTQAGYEVFQVTGMVKERKAAMRALKARVKAGERFDFVYSESTTKPNTFTGRYQYPLNPFFDYSFFRFCRRNGIRVGLFYRDVFWRFPFYVERVGRLRAALIRPFYYWDLLNYRTALDILFLPAAGYGEHLPWLSKEMFKELPPGLEIIDSPDQPEDGTILYVGGLGDHYRMQEAFAAVSEVPNSKLIVCTRELEWQTAMSEYPILSENIEIVHESGEGLDSLFDRAQYTSIFVQVGEYWKFAVPLKLYEYLGRAKPILASEGSYSAKIVEQLGIGWVLPYSSEALQEFLASSKDHSEEYRETVERMRTIREDHTWKSRATLVASQLNSIK